MSPEKIIERLLHIYGQCARLTNHGSKSVHGGEKVRGRENYGFWASYPHLHKHMFTNPVNISIFGPELSVAVKVEGATQCIEV